MTTKPFTAATLALLGAVLLTACGNDANAPSSASSTPGCRTRAYDTIGGPISLLNQNGERVTEAAFKGKDTLVYFGFASCPDVCPLALRRVSSALDLLSPGTERPQVVFITVDPERDTVEDIAAYVNDPSFPTGLVGLTGSDEEVRAAAEAFKAGYRKVDLPDSAAKYTMDHTSILYLMDRDWKLKTFFTEESGPEAIATCISELSN